MKKYYPLLLFVFCIILFSCNKIENKPTQPPGENAKTLHSNNLRTYFNAVFENHDNDSIERITVLGVRLTNPYLIPNVTQAYHNLGIYNVPVVVTNLYVRFKPVSADQLSFLDSTMELQDLELFDTPVDFDITYEGDYYQDNSIPEEQITWQYAVVPPNFQFPAGIPYETLAQIHIPGDDYTAVETEAENLAAGGTTLAAGTIEPNVPQCLEGYHWDTGVMMCVPDNCQPGYHWNGTACVINTVILPPAPAVDAAVPAGYIRVHDTQLLTDPGVRKTRIVAKRWFKIERLYTDNNGHFQCTKRFKHKVKINVKFKNGDAQVRGFRGIRLWQMLWAVKKTIGVFSGDKSAIPPYIFAVTGSINSKGNRYFAAATVHNALQEYRDYAAQEGIALPPTGIKIMLTNLGSGTASTPMFSKRWSDGLINELLLTFFISSANPVAGGLAAVLIILKRQVDIIISYNVPLSRFTSDFLKETAYHELTHAGHYAALGNGWYSNFVSKEISAVIANFNGAASPYGNGTNTSTSPVIALGEGWAYYMGHFLSDRTYGVSGGNLTEQGFNYSNNNPVAGLSSHLNLLEDFSPYRTGDPFHWIPQGLFYDLRDLRNEQKSTGGNVDDNVSNYTNQQLFNAFQNNIYSLQDYRLRLLQTTTNTTSSFVPNLFFQYGY